MIWRDHPKGAIDRFPPSGNRIMPYSANVWDMRAIIIIIIMMMMLMAVLRSRWRRRRTPIHGGADAEMTAMGCLGD